MFTYHYTIAGAGNVGRAYLCALETLRSRAFGSVVVTPVSFAQAISEGMFVRCEDPDVLDRFVQAFEVRLQKRKVKAAGRAWTGIYDTGEGSGGGWAPVDRLEGDFLRAVDEEAAEAARRQRRPRKGDVVIRNGHRLQVLSAGKSQVKTENVATGQRDTVQTDRFLGRRLRKVEPDPAMQQPLKPIPVPERAWAIASSEIVGVRKILALYRLRRETEKGSDGWLACTWYIGQLKRGEKVRRWKGA